jgi:hypothetical protein
MAQDRTTRATACRSLGHCVRPSVGSSYRAGPNWPQLGLPECAPSSAPLAVATGLDTGAVEYRSLHTEPSIHKGERGPQEPPEREEEAEPECHFGLSGHDASTPRGKAHVPRGSLSCSRPVLSTDRTPSQPAPPSASPPLSYFRHARGAADPWRPSSRHVWITGHASGRYR